MKYPPIHYHDYLQLEKLLNAQQRRSEELGSPAHDEMLFISVHQAYEVWFKQILFELDAIRATLSSNPMPESELGTAVRRLERILMIFKLSLGHIDILETMTPLDFLDFRDMLYPASGFQSVQFRQIEIKLGLKTGDRLNYSPHSFIDHLPESHREATKKAIAEPSLFDLVQNWLERTPFLNSRDFHFWSEYERAVLDMLKADRETVLQNARLGDDLKAKNIAMIENTEKTFRALFNDADFNEQRQQGQFRLSAEAVRAALFIQLYRDEPILHQPFRLLSCLLDLDEIMANWRSRHAQMALRMLGRKIGTGGSSGHDYLRDTAEKHRIFGDFFALATFLIPRSKIPALPKEVRSKMNFTTDVERRRG